MAKKNRTPEILLAVLIVAVITAVVVLVLNMNGKAEYTDTNPPKTTVNSTTCKSSGIDYPIFEKLARPLNESSSINLVYDNSKVKEIGLEYTATFVDENKAKTFYNFALNEFMSALHEAQIDDMGAFSNQTTLREDKVYLTLRAENTEINEKTAKFFLITPKEGEHLPRTVSDYQKAYTEIGFRCQKN